MKSLEPPILSGKESCIFGSSLRTTQTQQRHHHRTRLVAENVLLPQLGLQGEDGQHGPYRESVRAGFSNGVLEGDLVGKVAGSSAPGVPVVPDC